MPTYLYRAVCRRADGTIGLTLDQREIEADDEGEAVRIARGFDLDLAVLGANAVYLTTPDGRAIWSLHAPGPSAG